jgi:hypothetical protein
MLEQSLRKLFEQQAQVEPPPGRISIGEVLRQGRLRRRRRRISVVGTPVLAAVAAAAIALPLGIVGQSSPQAGRYEKPVGVFDPSYLAIGFGWLPAGAIVTGGQTSSGGEALSVTGPQGKVAVGVYARNLCHISKTARRFDCLGAVNAPTVYVGTMPEGNTTLPISGHGPAIEGHDSLWLSAGVRSVLAWQYAPGAWTVVQSGSDQATTVRIARAVEYGQHVPVRFASRFTSLPPGWRISGLAFGRDKGVYLASTYVIARLRTIRPATPVFRNVLDGPHISISPANSASHCGFIPQVPVRQVTIHGYRFTVQRSTGGPGPRGKFDLVVSALCGNHVDGLLVWVSDWSVGGPMFPPTEVMERMQLLGPKLANWVTNPLP